MRIKLFTRVMLTLYLILMLLVCIVGAAILLRVSTDLNNFIHELLAQRHYRIWGVVAGLAFFLVTFRLMLSLNRKPPRSVLLTGDGNHSVRISIAALDQIAREYCMALPQVVSVRFDFHPGKGGIWLRVWVALEQSANVPEMTQTLREGLTTTLNEMTKLTLARVNIKVEPRKNDYENARMI